MNIAPRVTDVRSRMGTGGGRIEGTVEIDTLDSGYHRVVCIIFAVPAGFANSRRT